MYENGELLHAAERNINFVEREIENGTRASVAGNAYIHDIGMRYNADSSKEVSLM